MTTQQTEKLWERNSRYMNELRIEYRKRLVAKGVAYITVIAVSFYLGAYLF